MDGTLTMMFVMIGILDSVQRPPESPRLSVLTAARERALFLYSVRGRPSLIELSGRLIQGHHPPAWRITMYSVCSR